MVNFSNMVAGILSFIVGLAMLIGFNTTINYFISSVSDLVTRVIMMAGYIVFMLLLMFYFPIHVLTSEDKLE